MKRISVVLGTRPEAIKLAPVVHALRAAGGLEVELVATGQHRQMLDQALAVFGLEPDADLALMTPDQSPAELHARALEAVSAELARSKPDLVVVQGDTTTVLAAAEAAFYARIPVAHVEAGLRTHDPSSPFPEEMNRVLVSHIARLHFAPTALARDNLLREGIAEGRIHVTGNTVIDALLATVARIRSGAVRPEGLDGIGEGRMILVTGHRRENFGEPIRAICAALVDLGERLPDRRIVYPVHLNPRIDGPVRELLSAAPNVRLLPPVDYVTFVALMDAASVILTDSGGVQEEAPSLGKPVLVMRENSERPEGIAAGTARLVGTGTRAIVENVMRLIDDPAEYEAMSRTQNPYGDGRAAERIAGIIAAEVGVNPDFGPIAESC